MGRDWLTVSRRTYPWQSGGKGDGTLYAFAVTDRAEQPDRPSTFWIGLEIIVGFGLWTLDPVGSKWTGGSLVLSRDGNPLSF